MNLFRNMQSLWRRGRFDATYLFRRGFGGGALPDFMIIGAQKSGTTSLFDYLLQSPDLLPPLRKETHHFDRLAPSPLSAYRAFFPSRRRVERERAKTGEATPFYMFHPDVPRRIRDAGLTPRLIAILRCPVERARSHYEHERRKGREKLSFKDALSAEPDRLRATTDRVLDADHLHALRHYSYVSRGRYMQQLRRFIDVFGADRLLVVSIDRLRKAPLAVVSECCAFIGVDPPARPRFDTRNVGSYGTAESGGLDVFRKALADDLAELGTILPDAEIWHRRLLAGEG